MKVARYEVPGVEGENTVLEGRSITART